MRLHRLTPEENRALVALHWRGDATEEQRLLAAQASGRSEENIRTVLTHQRIDIYLATSMRDVEQYNAAIEVYDWLRERDLSVFAPFFMTSASRFGQSELEAVAIERSSGLVAVYGTTDTYGIDSEVADMLKQGKDAYIYLAPQADPEKMALQRKRHKTFKDVHPRTLISPQHSSYLHGAHVVDDLGTLGRCLDRRAAPQRIAVDGRQGYACGSCQSVTLLKRSF